MSQTFHQSVEFDGVTVKELFRTYMTSAEHAAALGAPAFISKEVGSPFRIFGADGVKGRNLAIVPDRMVVQTWRGQVWKQDDLDSVLVLTFAETAHGARIDLVQVNVPDHAYTMVNEQAWNEMYWRHWKEYFATRRAAANGGSRKKTSADEAGMGPPAHLPTPSRRR